jgi:hypothetical protein
MWLFCLVDDDTGKYRPADEPRFAGTYARAAAGGNWEVVLKGGTRWLFQPFAGITGVIRYGPTDVSDQGHRQQRQRHHHHPAKQWPNPDDRRPGWAGGLTFRLPRLTTATCF